MEERRRLDAAKAEAEKRRTEAAREEAQRLAEIERKEKEEHARESRIQEREAQKQDRALRQALRDAETAAKAESRRRRLAAREAGVISPGTPGSEDWNLDCEVCGAKGTNVVRSRASAYVRRAHVLPFAVHRTTAARSSAANPAAIGITSRVMPRPMSSLANRCEIG